MSGACRWCGEQVNGEQIHMDGRAIIVISAARAHWLSNNDNAVETDEEVPEIAA